MKDGELPVLPLSVYGAVAMAHSDVSEEYSSPNQFFFFLYDKRNVSSRNNVPDLIWLLINYYANVRPPRLMDSASFLQSGLGGLSFDEGQFSVFG